MFTEFRQDAGVMKRKSWPLMIFINNSTDKYLLILEVEFYHCRSSNNCAKMQVEALWSSMLDLPLIQDYLQYQVDFYCYICDLYVNTCLDQQNVCFMYHRLMSSSCYICNNAVFAIRPCDIWNPLSRNAKKNGWAFVKMSFLEKGSNQKVTIWCLV